MKIPGFRPKIPDSPQRTGFIDEQINEAMARGDFNNLKGQGKPLQLRGDLTKLDEMRQKLRGDANYGAPWEEVRREIEHATGRAEAELKRAVEFRRAGLQSPKANPAKIEADFAVHLRNVQTQIEAVNSLVLKHNLLLPPQIPHLYRSRLRLSTLLEKIAPELQSTYSDA